MTYRCMMAVSGWSSTPSTAPSSDHIADTVLMESKSQSTCLRDSRPYNLKYRGVLYTVVDDAVPQVKYDTGSKGLCSAGEKTAECIQHACCKQ